MDNNFSVVTTCFNDSKNIISYLDSIVHQSLLPNEIVIVDGGSKDNTIQVVEDYSLSCTIPIQLIKGRRLNIAEGFNVGIKSANNQYVLLSCIGNRFSETMCEDLYSKMMELKCDATYGLLVGIDKGKFSRLYNLSYIGSNGLDVMSNRSVMYNKKVFEIIGLFIENFKYAGEDAEFLNRFDANRLTKELVNKPTVFWETPNSWKEFTKQCKNYAIAELQYAKFSKCLFSLQMRRWYLIFLLFILTPFSLYFPAIGLLYLITRIIKLAIHYKSLKVALFTELGVLLKIYYSFLCIQYILPSKRVCKLTF